MRLLKIRRNSIQFKLFSGVLIVVVPLISLLFFNNFYAIHVVRDQIYVSNKNMISLYMGQIDENLDDVSKYLYKMASSNPDLIGMNQVGLTTGYELSKLQLSNDLNQDILLLKAVDSIFVYSIPNDDVLKTYRNSPPDGLSVYGQLFRRLRAPISSPADVTKPWYVEQFGKEHYLVTYLKTDHLLIGAWVNVKNLLMPLGYVNSGKNVTSLFATDTGVPIVNEDFVRGHRIDLARPTDSYYLSGEGDRFLVVREKSQASSISLVALVPDSDILKGLPYLTKVIALCFAAVALLVPISLMMLRKTVLLPLRRILTAMKLVKEGNLKVAIAPYPTSDEFETVNESFNNMIQEIETLKINYYEEQLRKQQAELNYYQLQIKPHFFLNAINVLYSLAHVRKYEVIQELCIALSRYFRYMLQTNQYAVSLDKELKHVRNYLRIQELRFPERFRCEIRAQNETLPLPVPPLTVQTFVENAVKHAMSMDRVMTLTVETGLRKEEGAPRLWIRVRDTGGGFSKEALAKLQAGERIVDEDGEHIGVWNIRERLSRLHPGSKLTFSNRPEGGASVEVLIPV
ncbi:sensor histidine kinase [Cohnella thermotolerans]|uniref:sensor histidine kinase n=1 Tax=Cohnella thermotolerans TaxID=329858 RepID=UPI00041AFB98|nr:histidine kinase [Cohnella thermotolerans]